MNGIGIEISFVENLMCNLDVYKKEIISCLKNYQIYPKKIFLSRCNTRKY
jgi:hypothetical protein